MMMMKELLLVVMVFVVASMTFAAENVDEEHSVRRRRDSGHHGMFQSHLVPDIGGNGRQSWTVRRRVSTGSTSNVSQASSSTESKLTAEQWRRRERSVMQSSPALSLIAATDKHDKQFTYKLTTYTLCPGKK